MKALKWLHGLNLDKDIFSWLKNQRGQKIWDNCEDDYFMVAVLVNGAAVAPWILGDCTKEFRLVACEMAESVLPIVEELTHDQRPRKSIEAARKYVLGKIGEEELEDNAIMYRGTYAGRLGHAAEAASCTCYPQAYHAMNSAQKASKDSAYPNPKKEQALKNCAIIRKYFPRWPGPEDT